jgi:Sec-independent protein secretion pathway component TatC
MLYLIFLLIATLITPPEVIYQLVVIVFIVIIYELIIIYAIIKTEFCYIKLVNH